MVVRPNLPAGSGPNKSTDKISNGAGRKDKEWGLCPISMLDEDRVNMKPEDQLDYTSFVVLPCMQLMESVLPKTRKLKTLCNIVRDHWRDCIQMKGVPVWLVEDSYIQKNEN